MATNFAVQSLISTLRDRAAANTPIRTMAEESGLGRGTVFGLIHGQHSISPERARAALVDLAQRYEMPYFGADGVRDVHPARGSDASKLGRWWHDYGVARRTKFVDMSAL